MTLEKCKYITLSTVTDPRGSLSFVEAGVHVPFEIRRIYYLYDVPDGEGRGAHAHKELQQLIIAVSGSFDVTLDDGREKKKFTLDSPNKGLYVCPMIWRDLSRFSSDAVCLVLASDRYAESDYYRNYVDFLVAARETLRGPNEQKV